MATEAGLINAVEKTDLRVKTASTKVTENEFAERVLLKFLDRLFVGHRQHFELGAVPRNRAVARIGSPSTAHEAASR